MTAFMRGKTGLVRTAEGLCDRLLPGMSAIRPFGGRTNNQHENQEYEGDHLSYENPARVASP